MNSIGFDYRKIEPADRIWVEELIAGQWGSSSVVVHGRKYYPAQLEGYIASYRGRKIGLVTYQIEDQECEIVTLNSLKENCGAGRALVKLVEKDARESGCDNIWLITTNDNLKGIGFYQSIGYQLVSVYTDAVTESRKIKPEIPLIAKNGIPIRDELKFMLKIKI
jgi:ribosomal protein S18 acetylase RimI-like enzyme